MQGRYYRRSVGVWMYMNVATIAKIGMLQKEAGNPTSNAMLPDAWRSAHRPRASYSARRNPHRPHPAYAGIVNSTVKFIKGIFVYGAPF